MNKKYIITKNKMIKNNKKKVKKTLYIKKKDHLKGDEKKHEDQISIQQMLNNILE
jgi:hypothetical protein